MIKSFLVAHLLSLVISQSPPVQDGDVNQYVLVKLNQEFNLTCPFTDVEFYKWNNLKTPTLLLSEQRDLKIKLVSYRKTEIYECEAVNGYGKKTAIFIAKAIDTNSKQFEIDCQSRETGPCFLVTGLTNEFEYIIEENKKVAMDCRAVMNSSFKENLIYSWKRIPTSDSFNMKFRNSEGEDSIKNTGQLLDDVPPINKIEASSVDDMSKWKSIVMFEKVTKDMGGLYQCTVSGNNNSIKRTFTLKVRETKASSTIEGPLFQNIQAPVGSTQTLYCKASVKPKWGKKLDDRDGSIESEEIIKWGESRYKMLQGSLDIEHKTNDGSVKNSNVYINILKLENLQISHSGIYICTALASRTMDHKYVNLTVEAGPGYSESNKKSNNFPIYIAVPTTVFIICLATIIYCLIHRRIRQKTNFKNRVVRGTTVTTTNSSSGNGSYSGSKNTSNPRHHMLTTTTSSSKGSQNKFSPNSCYSGNITSVPGYGSNHPTFSSGYAPSTVNYNYNAAGSYIQATNNTPCSTDIDHPCSHHNCMPHNGHPVPYDSDSTPSPPPPTSIADTVSSSALNIGNPNGLAPYSITGISINSYSPNQSSQVYIPSQTPQGSSSTSASSPNAMYAINQQQPVYPVGVVYSA